ncbi:MAG: 4-hydroxythreonine-4-phosphate dehydrogenase PdxA [Opitutaceae bacterium]|jgi:4-hydroxythreonine-4-phosphate dehydrogenase|nr:4-hydroxythreonine-4-phosphate dehydrogenase PdxA [Opitutaceae bacterium]
MSAAGRLPLAVTCGDPAGVGPEIIARWLADGRPADDGGLSVAGPEAWLDKLPLRAGDTAHPVGVAAFNAIPGKPTPEGARVALDAMEWAAAACREGRAAGVVTGPVSKAELAAIGYGFPGQTEFFADRWGGVPVMAFCGGRLNVALLTWHIPFAAVPSRLTPDAFRRAVEAAVEIAGTRRPRVAVCGLNPHAGEGGILGTEERDVINPILAGLRGDFDGSLSDALPADTVFARALRGEFDAVVALYHDQGLAPLKTVEFDEAVNVTLGLPWVRTSPDHGTAFGIAGRGEARTGSFANAVRVARRLVARRAGAG